MMEERSKSVAATGYHVSPTKNGGFILYADSSEVARRRDEYAFSNSADLIDFLVEQHAPKAEG